MFILWPPNTPFTEWNRPNPHPFADAARHRDYSHSQITLALLPDYSIYKKWNRPNPSHWQVQMDPVHSNAVQALAGGTLSALKTNILEFLIIHCLRNTALKKTMHHLYIPCPPTTPSTQAGADRLLIQCLQSVHLEVHLGVHNENLQHLYRTPPPTTSWQVRTGANNIPPIVVYLLSTVKSSITCLYHATMTTQHPQGTNAMPPFCTPWSNPWCPPWTLCTLTQHHWTLME